MTRNPVASDPGMNGVRQCVGVEPDHRATPWRLGLWPCMMGKCDVEPESRSLYLGLPSSPYFAGYVALGMLLHSP